MAPSTITVRELVKNFGATRALDGVDLTVARGEIHGFLGPNGAGKSTTIRVLLGLLRPDSGQASVLGGDPWHDAVALHRRLAYVPGDVSLWPNLTGGEAIDVFARLRGGFNAVRRAELIEKFDLDPTKKGRSYSKGNRQKVAIVAALVSDVELLILDEPTAGLDPLMDAVFQEEILAERAAGRTVLLSSHTLAQVEKLSDRISIIRSGKVVESGSLDELRHLTRTTISARTTRPASGLEQLPGVHNLQLRPDGEVTLDVDGAHVDGVIGTLHAAGIRALSAHPPSLEQLFLRHYAAQGATTDTTPVAQQAGTDDAAATNKSAP